MAVRDSRSAIADAGARLYDIDFYVWCFKTAELLRLSFATTASLSPAESAICRRHRFAQSEDQRGEIEENLRDNPSLRSTLANVIDEVYDGAAKRASVETGLPPDKFPPSCPFTLQEIPGDE